MKKSLCCLLSFLMILASMPIVMMSVHADAVLPEAITESDFIVNVDEKVYTGSKITTEIKSNLVLDTEYTVSYENNVNVGEATVTITGIGNYQGVITKTFVITEKPIFDESFIADVFDKTYTGSAITPSVTSNLVKDVDYTVTYLNNVEIGQAFIQIDGIGNYTGTILKSFMIEAENNSGTTTLPGGNNTGTIPGGSDPGTTPGGNNSSTDGSTITPGGNNTGTNIVPTQNGTNVGANGKCAHMTIFIYGRRVATYYEKGYSGDLECGICGVPLGKGVESAKLKLAKPKFKAKAVGNKLRVTYAKVKDANRFQVRYKVRGKWKIKTFKAKKNITKFIKILTPGKYKVQVRAMIKKDDKIAFSKWAKVKRVEIK